jgi:hypothetical protein
VIQVRRRLEGVEPVLPCAVCRRAMPVDEAWPAFVPPDPNAPQRPTVLVHQGCVEGQAQAVLGARRVVLWRLLAAEEEGGKAS